MKITRQRLMEIIKEETSHTARDMAVDKEFFVMIQVNGINSGQLRTKQFPVALEFARSLKEKEMLDLENTSAEVLNQVADEDGLSRYDDAGGRDSLMEDK